MATLDGRAKSLVIALLAAAAIIGLGVVTYFTGSDEEQGGETPEYINLDLGTVSGSSTAAQQVLFLPWGSGPVDASRAGIDVSRSTIESVFSSGGRVFVVDHPEGLIGARIRWFSPGGDLLGTHLAPSGSTLFRPHEGGLNYVVAKSGGRSERAVVVDVDASVETTYTIPLQLNSGGLVYFGDTLYASVNPSDVDHEAQVIYSRYALVPVAVGGVQVDDATADTGAVELWGFGMDGLPYTATTEVKGLEVTSSEIVTVIGSGEQRVRVPRQYRMLGVSADSKIYLSTMPPPATIERPEQLSASWISEEKPHNEVLVITLDGKIDSCIVLPYSSLISLYDSTLPMALSEDGLYSLRETEGGVAVVVHRSN